MMAVVAVVVVDLHRCGLLNDDSMRLTRVRMSLLVLLVLRVLRVLRDWHACCNNGLRICNGLLCICDGHRHCCWLCNCHGRLSRHRLPYVLMLLVRHGLRVGYGDCWLHWLVAVEVVASNLMCRLHMQEQG